MLTKGGAYQAFPKMMTDVIQAVQTIIQFSITPIAFSQIYKYPRLNSSIAQYQSTSVHQRAPLHHVKKVVGYNVFYSAWFVP